MKIALTGHTSGIGKELHNLYPDAICFSRSNGFDIANNHIRNSIVEKSQICDVFINNAYAGNAQQELLSCFWEQWKNKDKIIINISSRAADYSTNNSYQHYNYASYKHALENTSLYMAQLQMPCKVICVKPGYVDTPAITNVVSKKITAIDVANFIKSLIEIKGSFWIPMVTLYPK